MREIRSVFLVTRADDRTCQRALLMTYIAGRVSSESDPVKDCQCRIAVSFTWAHLAFA
ncbi:hypothetical protein BDN67DRAFT_971505 [Paxillus ammoniavirescens]|nr:hypothetical protein BDN67DRAFT_971505 [Paxillus ammoniavirescens]